MWGLVGTGLLIFGMNTLFGRSLSVLNADRTNPGMMEGIALSLALTVGFIKGNFVLKKLALKYTSRIHALPEMSPVYMTFAPKNWILVIGMITLGKIVRTFGASPLIIGGVYVAIGVALVLGSRTYLTGHQVRQAGA